MNRIRAVGLALVAVVALSAVVATVASAVEPLQGPFYKVEGSRLLAGETRLLLATATENFVLTGAGLVITCTGLTLPVANEMQIIGSTGLNPGKSLELLDFTGCTVTGNGEKCDVENELVATNLIANLLGYSNSNRTGLVLVLFVPDNATKDFATIRFKALPGGECKLPSLLVEGTVAGLARVNGKPIEVHSEPAETLHGEVAFAAVNKTVWMESEGTLMSIKSGVKVAGLGATLTGVALLLVDLATGPVNWGVFTLP